MKTSKIEYNLILKSIEEKNFYNPENRESFVAKSMFDLQILQLHEAIHLESE